MQMVRNITENFVYVCQSTPEKVVVGVLSVYKGLLQLLAFFLAICIPRVKVKGLSDAKYIIAAVYVSSLGLILATLTHFTVTEYINTHTALYCIATCFSSTAILGLLFIPKVWQTLASMLLCIIRRMSSPKVEVNKIAPVVSLIPRPLPAFPRFM